MADKDNLIPGSTRVANARIIDRTKVRNTGLMETYRSGAVPTKFGYGGNVTEIAQTGNKTAFAIYHGGNVPYEQGYVPTHFGFGSGMAQVNPDPTLNVSLDQFVNGSLLKSGSGTITVIPSGQIQNFTF